MNETSAKITWSEGLIRRIEVGEPSPKAGYAISATPFLCGVYYSSSECSQLSPLGVPFNREIDDIKWIG
jgi:hypothetical protein